MNAASSSSCKHLYKYYGFKGLLATLQNRASLWNHPSRFNDPFDSQFKRQWTESLNAFLKGRADIPKALRKSGAFQKLMQAEHEQNLLRKTYMWELYFQKKLDNTVMLCLTEDHQNLLMWAHYAQNHSGGVIQFTNCTVQNCLIETASPVRYTRKIPVFEFAAFFEGTEHAEKKRKMLENFWDTYTLTKSQEWRYEKEWRLLLELEEPAKSILVDFDPLEVAAVYLGCRMAPKSIAEIKMLMQSEYPRATLFKAATHPSKFELEFEQIR